MNSTDFREELVKIMPGYDWTVHKPFNPDGKYFCATGIQSSGFNRISTLQVERRDEPVSYEVKYSGFGKKTPWLSSHKGVTLARVLRQMQEFYEAMTRTYAGAASCLQRARKA